MNTYSLAKSGIRPTRARVAVMEALTKGSLPLSVEEVRAYPAVRKLDVDPVTIYRILDVFVTTGLVKRIELGEGKFRYERADRAHHHHVICTSCGSMRDVSEIMEADLERVVEKQTKFTVTSHSLEFFGICQSCSGKSSTRRL